MGVEWGVTDKIRLQKSVAFGNPWASRNALPGGGMADNQSTHARLG